MWLSYRETYRLKHFLTDKVIHRGAPLLKTSKYSSTSQLFLNFSSFPVSLENIKADITWSNSSINSAELRKKLENQENWIKRGKLENGNKKKRRNGNFCNLKEGQNISSLYFIFIVVNTITPTRSIVILTLKNCSGVRFKFKN